jgi:hypothetical protein
MGFEGMFSPLLNDPPLKFIVFIFIYLFLFIYIVFPPISHTFNLQYELIVYCTLRSGHCNKGKIVHPSQGKNIQSFLTTKSTNMIHIDKSIDMRRLARPPPFLPLCAGCVRF